MHSLEKRCVSYKPAKAFRPIPTELFIYSLARNVPGEIQRKTILLDLCLKSI